MHFTTSAVSTTAPPGSQAAIQAPASRRPAVRALAVTLAACTAGLGWTAGASAVPPTTSVEAGMLTVTDHDSAAEPLTVTCEAGRVRVNGAAAGGGAECASITSIVIDSAGGGTAPANTLELAGAGPADGYTALASTRITAGYHDTVHGSPVRDVITSDFETGAIEGGAGDDEIKASGQEPIDAGPGDDVFDRVWNPAITPTGGEGRDTAVFDYSTVGAIGFDVVVEDGFFNVSAAGGSARWGFASVEVVDARLPAGAQTVDGSEFPGSLHVDAGAGNDEVLGGTGSDQLVGGAGRDTLEGGPGDDVLTGDGGPGLPGADTITARDGERDAIDCGAGAPTDTVVADRIDAIEQCETIDVPPLPAQDPSPSPGSGPSPGSAPTQGPGWAPDRTAPVMDIRRASLRGSRLSFTVTCPPEESRCIGRAGLRARGRRGGGRVGASLGRVRLDVPGGRSQTVVKRLSRRRRLRLSGLRGAQLVLRLDVRDVAGNRTTQAARVVLRLAG